MENDLESIAYSMQTLPRFVDKHKITEEYFDWLKLIEQQCLEAEFSQLTLNCTNKSLLNELKELYIATCLKECEKDRMLRNVITWQLEQQFGSFNHSRILIGVESEKRKFFSIFEKNIEKRKLLENHFSTTTITIEQTNYILKTNIIAEKIFTNLTPNEKIPILIYKESVKVYPSFKNFENFQYPTKLDENSCFILHEYGFWIRFYEEKEVNKCQFNLKQSTRKNIFFKDVVDLLNSFNLNFTYEIEKSVFQGVFYFPNLLLDWLSFLDHTMTDSNFEYIVFDEKNISTKEWYILKIFINNEAISINVSQKIVLNHSKILRLYGSENFPVGSYYVKVSFHGIEDLSLIETIKLKISKNFYYSQHNSCLSEYLKILKTFKPKLPKAKPEDLKLFNTNKQLKQKAPEIFVTDYPRKCLHLPRILEDSENKSFAIKFPINGEPSKSRWYGCDHHAEAKFPGLRRNPLKNKDKFPVIPCCYIADQKVKPGSEYRKYYSNEVVEKTKRNHENVIFTTNRILPEKVFGTLPVKLLPTFYDINNKKYFRFGVHHSNDSLLTCLQLATGKDKPNIEWVQNNLYYCKQEINFNHINQSEFVDPIIYYRLMEEWFDVSIILFENEKDDSKMMNINPDNSYYANFEWKDSIVLILKNFGVVADVNKYPQCELICEGPKESPKFIFSKNETIKLRRIFDKYNNITRVVRVLDTYKCHQFINEHGHVYKLIHNLGAIVFDPLQPIYLNVPIKTDDITDNIIDNYIHLQHMYETELKTACLTNTSKYDEILDFSKTLSEKSRDWIAKQSDSFAQEYNSKYIYFTSFKTFEHYIKHCCKIKFSDPRIENNRIIYLETILEEDLKKLTSFKLYSLSKLNSNYIKEYLFEDSSENLIINIDNNWYIESK